MGGGSICLNFSLFLAPVGVGNGIYSIEGIYSVGYPYRNRHHWTPPRVQGVSGAGGDGLFQIGVSVMEGGVGGGGLCQKDAVPLRGQGGS